MREICFALTACWAVSGLTAQTTDYEQWNKQRILSALTGLAVSSEQACSADGIESSAWAGLQDEIAELHGGPLSPYDGIVFPNYHYIQIEHIVARKEADESGLCSRGAEARKQFAADLLNLTLAPGSLNASKGDNDAYDLESAEDSLFRDNLTDHGLCWWAAQSIRVKAKYQLSVDTDEKTSLGAILQNCAEEQVYRPKLTPGAEWTFREEFLEELGEKPEIASCEEPVMDSGDVILAAITAPTYLPDMVCVPDRSPGTEEEESGAATTTAPAADPRADQIAAQNACIATLDSNDLRVNCTNIEGNCPDVNPIRRGEPLYESLRDTDNDGVVCEGL